LLQLGPSQLQLGEASQLLLLLLHESPQSIDVFRGGRAGGVTPPSVELGNSSDGAP
jgi:hypothetical protein